MKKLQRERPALPLPKQQKPLPTPPSGEQRETLLSALKEARANVTVSSSGSLLTASKNVVVSSKRRKVA